MNSLVMHAEVASQALVISRRQQLFIFNLIRNNEKFIIFGKDFKLLIKFLESEQHTARTSQLLQQRKVFTTHFSHFMLIK